MDVAPLEAGSFLDAAVRALSETGDGFTVTSSFGAVFLPEEAETSSDALRVADQRLYVQKREQSGRRAPHEVLLQALYERSPDLRDHVDQVVEDAVAVGESLGLTGAELEELALAARLHDVGKLAIPDAVLQKPGPLDVDEWAFVKEHVVIGERILGAVAGLEARCGDRARLARALGRRRVRGRAERRLDPARRPDHRRLRRLLGDDLQPPLPAAGRPRAGARGAAPLLRHAVRPGRRGHLLHDRPARAPARLCCLAG